MIKDAESGLVIADLSDHTPVTIAKAAAAAMATHILQRYPPDPQVCQARYAR